MNIRKSLNLVLMAGAGLCIGTTARPAHATASNPCNVQFVRLNKSTTSSSGAAELSIYCGGNWYVADVANSTQSCNRGWDSMKIWAGVAEAGQLSGRQISFDYTSVSGCSSLGTYVINYVKLQ